MPPSSPVPPHEQCFCAMSLPSGFEAGSDGCSFPCAGNSGETCGGFPKGFVLFLGVYRSSSRDVPHACISPESLLFSSFSIGSGGRSLKKRGVSFSAQLSVNVRRLISKTCVPCGFPVPWTARAG